MPILIFTDAPSWEEYLKSLDNSARYEWRFLNKKFTHLNWGRWEFEKEPTRKLIEIWDSQIHCGGLRSYIITADMFEENKDKWMFFVAKDKDEVISVHPIRFFGEDGEPMTVQEVESNQIKPGDGIKFTALYAPLYDKNIDHDIAGYMWFHLVKYAIENRLPVMDFVGAGSWRENLRYRSLGVKYKWKFVPRQAKNNPDLQPDYIREKDKLFLNNESK